MALYHVGGVGVAAPAIGGAVFDLRPAASDRVSIREIAIFLTAATLAGVSLERSTTPGTASTTVVPQAGDPANGAATALVGTAFSVAPVGSGIPLRRGHIPANIGAGIVWTFAYGDLIVASAAPLAVYNRGPAVMGASVFHVTYDE